MDAVSVIKDIGGFLAEDAAGWLINPATGRTLQEEWRPAVQRVASTCRQEAGTGFDSFYVRGSVACGTAVKGSSDLDILLLLDDDAGERRPEWQHLLAERVLTESPFITDLEVVVLGRGALRAAVVDPERAGPVMAQWCFLLALGSRCLEGENILPELGRFRVGPEIAYVIRSLPPSLRVFEARLAHARAESPSHEVNEDLRVLCTWTCKKLLRAGAEIAMLTDPRFTRDLGPCAQQLGKRFPELADTAQQLLEWAIDPPYDLSGLERVVRKLEPVLTHSAIESGLILDEIPEVRRSDPTA